jgi:hypothetical protein
MKPNISEFSYGYAVTEELINSYGTALTAAPLFPSLIKEGQSDGGYDLLLQRTGLPLFLQFKLSDRMRRQTAREFKEGVFVDEFFRMHLRPSRHSSQHQALCSLERTGNEVYYVAPAFTEPDELNKAYLGKAVLAESVFFRPLAIGSLPDDGPHHVAFQKPGRAYRLSQPEAVEQLFAEGFTRRVLSHLNRLTAQRVPLADVFAGLRSVIIDVLRDTRLISQSVERDFSDLPPTQVVAYLVEPTWGANCSLHFLGRSPKRLLHARLLELERHKNG